MFSTTMAHPMWTSNRPCGTVLGFAIELEPESSGSPHIDGAAAAAAATADQRVWTLSAPESKPLADLPGHSKC